MIKTKSRDDFALRSSIPKSNCWNRSLWIACANRSSSRVATETVERPKTHVDLPPQKSKASKLSSESVDQCPATSSASSLARLLAETSTFETMDTCGYEEDAIHLVWPPVLNSSPWVCSCGQSKASRGGLHSTLVIDGTRWSIQGPRW